MIFRWRTAKLGSKLFQAMQDQSTDEHQLEVQALQEKMKEALAALKQGGQAALYGLPWLMIIGPSAAGKSTLLRHSGLHFPYATHQEIDIKGFAGTRNCDWWFADEAIILDTAGRYTTDEDDKPEWFSFLDMLKRHRRKAPIHGVIVALSLTDILKASEEVMEDHVKIIRSRLQELIQRLGVVFPVHIVLTKCDLLDGFLEYMQDLSVEAKEQIWGMTLTPSQYDEEALDHLLQNMYDKLCLLRMHKLALQPDSDARVRIMSFPLAFKEACVKFKPFLSLLLKNNPYQEQPDFKGFYFTSAYQMTEVQSGEKQQRRGYFIKQLFKKIIFVDKYLVRSQQANRTNMSIHTASGALSVVAMIIAIMLFHSSYQHHEKIYERVHTLLHDHELRGAGFTRQKWQSMIALHDEYLRLNHLTENKSLSFMLIERCDNAKKQLLNAWMSDMQGIFLKEVAQYLELDLQHQANAWLNLTLEQQQAVYGAFYDHLKTYLMLVEPHAHMAQHYAAPRLANHWAYVLGHQYPALSMPASKLNSMVNTFTGLMATPSYQPYIWRKDDALITQARSLLSVNPSPDTLYVHMKSELQDQLGEVSLNALLEGNAYGLFHSEVSLPRAFTREHMKKDVLPAIDLAVTRALEGDWVLNNRGMVAHESSAKQLHDHLRKMYFTDYAETWFAFLSSIEVRTFHSIDDASNKLALLQQPTGPMLSLMNVVKQNVFLSDTDLLESVSDKMPSSLLVSELDGPFYALRRMTQPGEKMAVAESINQYLHLVGRVQGDLLRLSHSSNSGRDAEAYARAVLSGSDNELTKALASLSFLMDASMHSTEFPLYGEKTRAAMEPLLLSAFENAWSAVLSSAGTYLQEMWDAQVVDAYQHTLRNKFPFSKTSMEATLEDVSIFFRPGDGVLSSFQDSFLQPYLQWTRNGYVAQTWLGKGLEFSDSLLESLSIAKRVSDGFFRSSGSEMELTFYVSPVPTPGIEDVIFDSNGQSYRYRNEPEEWRRFVWPGDSADMGARLYVSENEQKSWAEMHKPGVWGLFHLLNAATLISEGGAQYLSQWQVKNAKGDAMNVRFKLRADKQHNIFEPGLLQRFALPDTILQNDKMTIAQHEEIEHVRIH